MVAILHQPFSGRRFPIDRPTAERIHRAESSGVVVHSARCKSHFEAGGIPGMRPGEIFGLKWANRESLFAEIRQRVYRGDIDSPKSPKSIRRAALSGSLQSDVPQWRALRVNTAPQAWVFPSENANAPVRWENVWRSIGPKLHEAGLGCVAPRILRRSCPSFMSDQGVDGKVVADQPRHGLDVNQNIIRRWLSTERQTRSIGSICCFG